MTHKEKNAAKLFAADVRRSLDKSTNIGISAYNYGVEPTAEFIDELRTMLPGVEMSTRGFMGYIHFERKIEVHNV